MEFGALPLIVLGGSDRAPGTLPAAGKNLHALSGYKGADLRFSGRPMALAVVDRLHATGAFDPIFIAGPEATFGQDLSPATLIETDGNFGDNIRASLEQVRRSQPGRPIAFIACDVLPDIDSTRELMQQYREQAPCDLWFPLVRTPLEADGLGTSGWKPIYRIPPTASAAPVEILPGHLVICDPECLRRDLLYRLFQLGYATRNRPLMERRAAMVRGALTELLRQDLRSLARFSLPLLTWSVLFAGLPTARALSEGRASLERLERTVRRIFVRRDHRKRFPRRRVRLPITDVISLARDIDTAEEARELGGEW